MKNYEFDSTNVKCKVTSDNIDTTCANAGFIFIPNRWFIDHVKDLDNSKGASKYTKPGGIHVGYYIMDVLRTKNQKNKE